jgi:hypothetical protein
MTHWHRFLVRVLFGPISVEDFPDRSLISAEISVTQFVTQTRPAMALHAAYTSNERI